MKKFTYYILSFAGALLLFSCKDIIEEDISNRTPVVKSPSNYISSTSYSQTFWWEEMEGASSYNIEIVKPSFDQTEKIILDTTIATNKFTKTLTPGSYQWRIRGINGSYQSKYQTYSLTINAGALKDQKVILLSPDNDKYYQAAELTFKWESVFGATQYTIEIDSVNSGSTPVKVVTLDNETEYRYTLPKEGDYKWKVQAKNATEFSQMSNTWYTGFYTSSPPAPTLSTPINGATNVGNPITFSWETVNRAKFYKLYIYIDSETSTPIIHEVSETSKSLSLNVPPGETIYWKVATVDKSGRIGAPTSPARSFTAQ